MTFVKIIVAFSLLFFTNSGFVAYAANNDSSPSPKWEELPQPDYSLNEMGGPASVEISENSASLQVKNEVIFYDIVDYNSWQLRDSATKRKYRASPSIQILMPSPDVMLLKEENQNIPRIMIRENATLKKPTTPPQGAWKFVFPLGKNPRYDLDTRTVTRTELETDSRKSIQLNLDGDFSQHPDAQLNFVNLNTRYRFSWLDENHLLLRRITPFLPGRMLFLLERCNDG